MIQAYRFPHGVRPRGRGEPRIPLSACSAVEGPEDELLDIYPDGDETPITCEACLEWLHESDNWLKLFRVNEWLRKHVAAEDRNIRYVDIPVPGDEDA